MAPMDTETDNEYVRRVGFALSFSHDNARARRLSPFAWLSVFGGAGFTVMAVLAYLR
jgi:hypothetical protein